MSSVAVINGPMCWPSRSLWHPPGADATVPANATFFDVYFDCYYYGDTRSLSRVNRGCLAG